MHESPGRTLLRRPGLSDSRLSHVRPGRCPVQWQDYNFSPGLVYDFMLFTLFKDESTSDRLGQFVDLPSVNDYAR